MWQIPSQVPLPPYSPEDEAILQGQRPVDRQFRNKMAEVAAAFYFEFHNDQLRHPSAYQLLGRRMREVYPALMGEGAHPWTMFVAAVSSKMRNKRFRENMKAKQRARYIAEHLGPTFMEESDAS